jgi:type I restriction enzyme, S subunit
MYVKVGDMNLDGNEYEILKSSTYFDKEIIKQNDLIPTRSIIFPKRGGAIATNKRRAILKEPILVDSNTMAVIPSSGMDFDFFLWWFNTIDLAEFGNVNIIPQVNNKDLIPLTIPLPPLAEQKRIVEKLEKLMKYCDNLEANIRESKKNAESLLQVALKEALEPK